MNKRILVLGGSPFQLPLVRASHELGYQVVLCDMRPECPGALEADKAYQVNYLDKEAVLQIARTEQVDGVISNNEPAMLTVAYVSEQLSLIGNSVASVQKLISKSEFRKLQRAAGVLAPQSFTGASADEIISFAKQLRYPIIVKPNEASGTRGAKKITAFDADAITESFDCCAELSRNGLVTVEEYIEMHSLIVNDADVFVFGDEILWDGLFQQTRAKETPMLPMTQIYPAQLNDGERAAIRSAVEKLLKAAGIRHGEFNVETYFTDTNEVFVIEINPRQAGNHIPQMICKHSGVDLTKLLVSTAVNDLRYYHELKTYRRENNYLAMHPVFSKKDGIFEALYIDPAVQKFVESAEICTEPGEPVETGINAGQVVAYVLLRFADAETQHCYAENIEQYIYPIVRETGNV